jgi:hypothetical protein
MVLASTTSDMPGAKTLFHIDTGVWDGTMMSRNLLFGLPAWFFAAALAVARRGVRPRKDCVVGRWALITQLASGFREFVAPRYRPELYYMRGPGPASARRAGAR